MLYYKKMPLKIPFLPQKSKAKPKGKTAMPSRGGKQTQAAPKRGKSAFPPTPAPAEPSWWDSLSAERKLDVVGIVMAVIGLLTTLILFSAQRSALTGKAMEILTQTIGWGVYILPVGLIVMGLWLVLRRIEKLPPLSLERAIGLILFFFWLLATMDSINAGAGLSGAGGGYIGSLFGRIFFNSLGFAGGIIALTAWLIVTITMIFDISVQDLFRWVAPLTVKIRRLLARQASPAGEAFLPEEAEVVSGGFTPMRRPEAAENVEVGKPVTTVKAAERVIQWKLPEVKNILDAGSAPEVNEEFIQGRSRLIW